MQPTVTRLFRPAASALRFQHPRPFICSGCLQSRHQQPPLSRPSRRHLTTTPPSAPVSSGLASLSSRAILSVSGPDAAKYLQGVITANIASPLNTTHPFYAAFLTAKGRVLHDVFIYPQHDPPNPTFLIEVDASQAPRLHQHIKRYKLRAKFDVRLLDAGEYNIFHAWSSNPTTNSQLSSASTNHPNILHLLQDPRAPSLGYRIITTTSSPPPSLPLDIVPEPLYHLHRYTLGIPEGQSEILRDQALPLESNIDLMGGIDFRKGCYVGQELTIRTKHRGVVRKRILPVMVYGDQEDVSNKMVYRPSVRLDGKEVSLPGPEARITRKEKPDRRVGQWLAGMGNIGLAVCRLETMTDIQVPGETASTGYDPERDEFVVSGGGEEGGEPGPQLKVKAFVPEWMRSELVKPAQ